MTPTGWAIVICVATVAAFLVVVQVVAAIRDERIARITGHHPRIDRVRRPSTVKTPPDDGGAVQ